MTHHILAVFNTTDQAAMAADQLTELGVSDQALSVVTSEGYRAAKIGIETNNKSAEGAATGATLGGVLGAIAGGLAATGAVVATGGGVLVAGPVAAALAGAGAGGATGGMLGGLMGLGVPEHNVKSYEKTLNDDSGFVLGVEVTDANKKDVRKILKAAGGQGISEE